MFRLPTTRRLPAVLLVAVTLTACSASDVTTSGTTLSPTIAANRDEVGRAYNNGNTDPKTASQKPFATANSNSFAEAKCVNRPKVSVSAKFGPTGGILEFGDSWLIIPGGALRDTVTITATVPDENSSHVEFAPHGLQFNKPAGLLLGTANCLLSNPYAPVVVYLSPDGQVLETIFALYDPHWHTIATPIDHFSGYAIAF